MEKIELHDRDNPLAEINFSRVSVQQIGFQTRHRDEEADSAGGGGQLMAGLQQIPANRSVHHIADPAQERKGALTIGRCWPQLKNLPLGKVPQSSWWKWRKWRECKDVPEN